MAHDNVAVQDAMIRRVNNFKRIDELRDAARHNAEKQQETQRHSQDLRSIIDEQRLTKGTLVFLKEERATHKLSHRFLGPFTIHADSSISVPAVRHYYPGWESPLFSSTSLNDPASASPDSGSGNHAKQSSPTFSSPWI